MLVDADVAGSGSDSDGWTSTIDSAGDMMPVELTLHGDGLRGVDAARSGVGIEIEVGVADGEADAAASG